MDVPDVANEKLGRSRQLGFAITTVALVAGVIALMVVNISSESLRSLQRELRIHHCKRP